MAREFKLPDLGEGIHEGEIVEVFVQPGDDVREGDPLLEVETDKAVTAIPSPFTGQVSAVRVRPGDVVTVGEVLVVFDAAGTDTEAIPPVPQNATAAAATESMKDRPVEDRPGLRTRPPVPAAPSTRRLARKLGVALAAVAPTGPEGLVTAEDVRRHAEEGAQTPVAATGADRIPAATIPPVASPDLPDFSRWGPVTAEPLRSVRRSTARQMALAWSQIPHVANQDEADVTRLEAWRKRHAAEIAAEDGRLTMTVLAAKAAVAALKRFPRFNASLDMAGAQIIYKHYHHVGVAVDSARGLIVPVLKDVDRRSIRELACEFNALVERAREGKTSLEELQGGTFTITNAGAVGGGHFTPIINYPQVAILGLGRAGLKPVVRSDAEGEPRVVPRLMMPLVLSFDHRIADGADAIRFMRAIIAMLEDPEQFLLDI
ncbi:MAG: dihydrolipoamide acetyltransferase family protein [Desulfobacterales bacterium]|nr:dihydrolipoamide acetyltransferase family protein [Desulfobacterales bacterium]